MKGSWMVGQTDMRMVVVMVVEMVVMMVEQMDMWKALMMDSMWEKTLGEVSEWWLEEVLVILLVWVLDFWWAWQLVWL